jgi:hypothetical protein
MIHNPLLRDALWLANGGHGVCPLIITG